MDKQILIPIFTASATVLASIIVVVVGKYYDKKRDIEQQQRIQKVKFYDDFLKKWFDVLDRLSDENTSKEINKEGIEFITNISWNLILWAGNDVIQEYLNFRKFIFIPDVSSESVDHGTLLLLQFEKVAFKIRKELGHENKGNNKLNQLDFLSLYINDVDTTLRPKLDSLNKILDKILEKKGF